MGMAISSNKTSEPIETHKNSSTPSYPNAMPISCQKGAECYTRQKKYPEITLRVVLPNFLSEGVRFGAKSKLARMGVYLAYIPIRDNKLGAEDDPLSQEIYSVTEFTIASTSATTKLLPPIKIVSVGCARHRARVTAAVTDGWHS